MALPFHQRVFHRLLGFTLGLLAGASLLSAAVPVRADAPAQGAAEPALWIVRDEDSTIYLFGTVHALRPTVTWRTPRIEAALKESDELKVEIVEVGEDTAGMQPLIQRLGLDPARPLSSRLTPQDRARLNAAAASISMPPAAFEPMRPWLAAVVLQVAPLLKAGYDQEAGVDRLLVRAAKAEGKRVTAFETVEQQLRFFADLPPEAELALLTQTLEDVSEAATLLDEIAEGWARGDLSTIDRLLVEEMKVEAPLLYQRLLVDRNAAWTDEIGRMMQGSGVTFVAVGAAHLAGPDSVQAMLEKRGVKVERR
jgi:hypothetical protein